MVRSLSTRQVISVLSIAAVSMPVFFSDSLAGVGKKDLVGRQRNGSVVLPTDQVIHSAGKHIEFRGRPNAVTLSPDGRIAALLNGTYKAIMLINMETGTVKQEFDAAGSSASFAGILYSKDGKKLYASQANGRVIIAAVATDGTLSLDRTVAMPVSTIPYSGITDGNPYPGGLALSEDGNTLYVALSRNNTLAVLDLATDTVTKQIPVGNAPREVVVLGTKAYVSNLGGRVAESGEFTNDSSGTPIVADPNSGRAITGSVSVVDLIAGNAIKSIEVGLHPSALLHVGSYVFVANTNSDTVSIIDSTTDREVKTISASPFPGAPFGSSPNSLAMLEDGQLAVSLGRNNAVALYRLGGQMYDAVSFEGLIPTGWYPTGIASDKVNRRFIVANGKGVGSLGPEATVGPDPATNKTGKWVHSNQGSASVLDFPDQKDIRAYTMKVLKNNNWEQLAKDKEPAAPRANYKPLPLPERLGEPSVFKHVFYVIKENRTYDQVFGALPQGNGDANLVQFGRDVTPNHHALAEQFVLLDNLYDSGSNSADGHQWVTQAFAVDYLEKSFGSFIRTYPFNGGDALAYAPSGFLWENALRRGKSVRVYGEYVNGLRADGVEIGPWLGFLGAGVSEGGSWMDFYKDSLILAGQTSGAPHTTLEAHSDIPSLEAIINTSYPPYRQNIPDQYRVEVFLKDFYRYVQQRNLPDFVVMCLTSDHTNGTGPGYPTPRAMVADNDLALGRIVEAISHSPYWKDSVIFVIEDDAQNGVDHVDGHRTIGFVISPYTKRGVVDSRYYTQIDFIRAMEQILGLPPMNQMDLAVEPSSLKQVFKHTPDISPFVSVPNQIPLDEMNPTLASLSGIQKEWTLASQQMDFSKPDAADEHLLNRVIWYATKGFHRPYPGDPRVFAPHEVHEYVREGVKVARIDRD
jgi:YVTN family beta-propeller protein